MSKNKQKKTTVNTSNDYEKKQREKLNKTSYYENSQREREQERARRVNKSAEMEIKSQVQSTNKQKGTSSFSSSVTNRAEEKHSYEKERKIQTSSHIEVKSGGNYQINTRAEKGDSKAYNPSKQYESQQQQKHGYESRIRNNENVRLHSTIQTSANDNQEQREKEDGKNIEKKKDSYPIKSQAASKYSNAYLKVSPQKHIPTVKSGEDNLHLYDVSRKFIQSQLQKSDDLGLSALSVGIAGAYGLKQYYKMVGTGTSFSIKSGKKVIKTGYKIATGTYRHTAKTVNQFRKYGVKGTIHHRVKNNHAIQTAILLKNKNTRNLGIQVLKHDGKFFVKGAGATTVKMGKATLKTTVKSGSYIVKTATAQGIDIVENALESGGDIGSQTLAAGIKGGKGVKTAGKVGVKATRFTYRGIKTGVKTGIKTGKATVSAVKYVRRNGWKKASAKAVKKTANGAKNLFAGLLKGIKNLAIGAGKMLGIGAIALTIVCTVVIITTPALLFSMLFGGTVKDENDNDWNVHDYVLEQTTDKIDTYADEIIDLYTTLTNDYEIITLYNNLSAEEVEISKDTIKYSIPTVKDFSEIIEPVFNVLMVTRYELTVTETEKQSTYDYLWNLLNNLYTQKLSAEYCTESPDTDGIYYAGDNCLRPSETKYHTSDSGKDCCTTTVVCGGHPLGNGVTIYCTESHLATCSNKVASFSCSGYKECLGHRRCRIVMDFNGINALIAEEWGDRINELELKGNLTDDEKEELKTLKSNLNFCLAFVEFLHLNDENYNTDYDIGGAGGSYVNPNINTDIDPDAYGLDDSVGARIALAGLQKVGYNYVYGGLTWCCDPAKKGIVGIDCSGFTYLIIKETTGTTIPRTSAAQSQSGAPVASLAQAKAGDLIFYGRNGVQGVGHVGIYIGNGQIVHASNPNDGVKVSNATYKTILAIRRYW